MATSSRMTADRRKSVESKIALSSLLRRHRRWSGLVRVTDRGAKKLTRRNETNMPSKATAKRPPMTPPAMGPESLLVWGGGGGVAELEMVAVAPVVAKGVVGLAGGGARDLVYIRR